MGTSRRKLPF
ncbi:BnaAnng16470D [Brassica napus]|uniref:BnaAnng16470D protein n=1 Tax=Brassica napus TaxID=3708 RepID=A0A078J2R3_BRANA|nr:BnaAnng16470D [Brassica napus]